MDKYKVDSWILETPKFGKNEFMTAWKCFKLLIRWAFLFYLPFLILYLIVYLIERLTNN